MSLLRLNVFAAALVVLPACAFAQGTPQQRSACRSDVVKFCKGEPDEAGALYNCLDRNKDKLAEKCRKVIEQN
jgi:hypothetical protein